MAKEDKKEPKKEEDVATRRYRLEKERNEKAAKTPK